MKGRTFRFVNYLSGAETNYNIPMVYILSLLHVSFPMTFSLWIATLLSS